jgi:hypothetical protein
MAKSRLTRREKRMYREHLRGLKEQNPEVACILDVTEEDADWLHQKPEEEKEARN